MKKDKKIEDTFDNFIPRDYLSEYLSHIGPETYNLLRFYVEAYKDVKISSVLLEFGGGPTIYQLIAASKYIREIHFSDYLQSNIAEVEDWKNQKQNAYNWSSYFRTTLELEGETGVTIEKVQERESLLRKKMTKFLHCDAFKENPLGSQDYEGYYDILSMNFVADSITDNLEDWRKVVKNICSLMKKDGILMMAALKGAHYWHVGNRKFPAVFLTEQDVRQFVVELGFHQESIVMQMIDADELDENGEGIQGYQGFICIKASKN